MQSRWEHFEHGADIGVRGIGPTMAASFEQAALALTGVVTDTALVRPLEPVVVNCEAPSDDILLVDWLNALVFEMATRRMLFARFEVSIDGHRHLHATAWGERVDPRRHEPAVEVKGATHTALGVRCDPAGAWTAQCIVDV